MTRRSSGWAPWRWRVTSDSRLSSYAACSGLSWSTNRGSWRLGMSSWERGPGEGVRDVRVSEDVLVVDLLDGRTISVPLVWYPRLLSATPEQRANWRIAGGGFGIHWPDVDEDVSTDGLLRGAPAPRGSAPTGRMTDG